MCDEGVGGIGDAGGEGGVGGLGGGEKRKSALPNGSATAWAGRPGRDERTKSSSARKRTVRIVTTSYAEKEQKCYPNGIGPCREGVREYALPHGRAIARRGRIRWRWLRLFGPRPRRPGVFERPG